MEKQTLTNWSQSIIKELLTSLIFNSDFKIKLFDNNEIEENKNLKTFIPYNFSTRDNYLYNYLDLTVCDVITKILQRKYFIEDTNLNELLNKFPGRASNFLLTKLVNIFEEYQTHFKFEFKYLTINNYDDNNINKLNSITSFIIEEAYAISHPPMRTVKEIIDEIKNKIQEIISSEFKDYYYPVFFIYNLFEVDYTKNDIKALILTIFFAINDKWVSSIYKENKDIFDDKN